MSRKLSEKIKKNLMGILLNRDIKERVQVTPIDYDKRFSWRFNVVAYCYVSPPAGLDAQRQVGCETSEKE